MKEKWKTWWWYHRVHVLIAVVAAAIILYSFLPGILAPKPDCSVAVISLSGMPDEIMASLEERFQLAAEDVNGDGRVLIEMNLYMADLSGETPGTLNYSEAAKLDADLVGNYSSILLIDDPEGFSSNTVTPIEPAVLCSSLSFFDGLALPEGMVFTIRSDSAAIWQNLYTNILTDR